MLVADEREVVDAALLHAEDAHPRLVGELEGRLQPVVEAHERRRLPAPCSSTRPSPTSRCRSRRIARSNRARTRDRRRAGGDPARTRCPGRRSRSPRRYAATSGPRCSTFVEGREAQEPKRGEHAGDLVVPDVGREDVLDDLLLVEKEHDGQSTVGIALVWVGEDLGERDVAPLQCMRGHRHDHSRDEQREHHAHRERAQRHCDSIACNQRRFATKYVGRSLLTSISAVTLRGLSMPSRMSLSVPAPDDSDDRVLEEPARGAWRPRRRRGTVGAIRARGRRIRAARCAHLPNGTATSWRSISASSDGRRR